jgi:hypothetical protein
VLKVRAAARLAGMEMHGLTGFRPTSAGQGSGLEDPAPFQVGAARVNSVEVEVLVFAG